MYPFIGYFYTLQEHILAIVFGYLVLVLGILYSFNILLFKSLIISNSSITKEWLFFGKRKIYISDLTISSAKRICFGQVHFKDKNLFYIFNYSTVIEIFPFGNNKFKEIKNALIENKAIESDDYNWN